MGAELAEAARVLEAYDPAFRERMGFDLAEALHPPAALLRAAALPHAARDLLDTLLLSCGPGATVEQRFWKRVDAVGGPLWLAGLLVPSTRPGRGAFIDPTFYAASCRVSPALAERRPFGEHLRGPPGSPTPVPPATNARWDSVVVAAALERGALPLGRDGQPRRDTWERLRAALGEDQPERWDLALRYARLAGLARPVDGRLVGFPESPHRPVSDPTRLLEEHQVAAGRALLRLVGPELVDLGKLLDTLRERARDLLGLTLDDAGWARREGPLFVEVADVLVRARVLDAVPGLHGPTALCRLRAHAPGPPGFLLTPDLEILVAPWELPLTDYGRLCRMAPYRDGHLVHRHRLTREGVAADLALGHTDPSAFLARYSRTGLPATVGQTLASWQRAAARVTVWSGVTVVEHEDGRLERVEEEPADAAVVDYGGPEAPTGRLVAADGQLAVPLGEDPLTLRALVELVATPVGVVAGVRRYRLQPRPVADVEALLYGLGRHGGALPPEVEVAVRAAQGAEPVVVEPARIVRLPLELADALFRDPVAGPLLLLRVGRAAAVVELPRMAALRERLAVLGLQVTEAG